ncbi:MAG: non-hydrolyzing UDP-N-acetylglucosamine 2-epimerase [Chitinophagaceae bacterium]
MKIVTVVGARPQFIKAAVVTRALGKKNNIQEIIVHTGQHYDNNMSGIFFEEMQIPKPAYNLQIKEKMHGAMTAKMLEGLEKIFIIEKPDTVLVYGDTNSTLSAAIAASKLHIPVAHIEAGLRSFNMQMPEEINRIITDRLSSFLFCPTQQAINNLNEEGFSKFNCSVYLAGDVMFDAAMYYYKKASSDILQNFFLNPEQYFLCTLHRAENTNNIERLKSIVKALNILHTRFPVIVPLHPRTVNYLKEFNITTEFTILKAVGYIDMLQLIANSKLILTDSGGLQKEAFFFKKFCITLRDETEWVELVEHGCNAVTGADTEKILKETNNFLHQSFKENMVFYGNGNAGEKIAEILETSLFQ